MGALSAADRLLAEGVALFNAGKPAAALERFRGAARLGRDTVEVRCYEAQSLQSCGQGAEAAALLEALAKRAPREPGVWQNLASVLRLQGRREEAARALRRGLERRPGHAALKRALAELEAESALEAKSAGREDEAVAAWRRALALAPGDARARAALTESARAAAGARRSRSATRAARAELRRRERRGLGAPPDALKRLLESGDFEAAFAEAERALAGPGAVEAVRALWNPWPAGLDDEKRLARLRRLETLDASGRGGPWPAYMLGVEPLSPDMGSLRRAVLAGGRRRGWMRGRLAAAWLAAGRFEEAQAALARCASWRPRDWRPRVLRAKALLALGRRAEAGRELARAVAEAPPPEKDEARAWSGAAALWLGRTRRAVPVLERARAGGCGTAAGWLGAALVLSGRPDEALAPLEQAAALRADDAEPALWKAQALLDLGRPREALAAAARLPGRWPCVLRGLARAALGDAAGAAREHDSLPQSWKALLGEGDAARRLRRAVELGGGYRGEEAFGLCLWMR